MSLSKTSQKKLLKDGVRKYMSSELKKRDVPKLEPNISSRHYLRAMLTVPLKLLNPREACPSDEAIATYSEAYSKRFKAAAKMDQVKHEKKVLAAGYYSLCDVLLDLGFPKFAPLEELVSQPNTDPELKEAYYAMMTRILRFSHKLYSVFDIVDNCKSPSKALTIRFQTVLHEITLTNVILPYKDQEGVIKVPTLPNNENNSPAAIMAHIRKKVKFFAARIRELIPGLIETWGFTYYGASVNVFNEYLQPLVKDIAPFGLFQTREHDFYHILRLLLIGSYPLVFSPVQQKQWVTYFEEANNIAYFLYAVDLHKLDLTVLYEFDKGRVIHLSVRDFFDSKPLSQEAFSRFISACNAFLPCWYLFVSGVVVKHKGQQISPQKKLK